MASVDLVESGQTMLAALVESGETAVARSGKIASNPLTKELGTAPGSFLFALHIEEGKQECGCRFTKYSQHE